MGYAQHHIVNVATDAAGVGTGFTPVVRGRVHAIKYIADGTAPYDATVDFTITTEDTAQNLWVESNVAASKTVAPRQPTHDTAGVASLYAAAGEPVEAPVLACGERIKIALAQGGNTKTGRFIVMVES